MSPKCRKKWILNFNYCVYGYDDPTSDICVDCVIENYEIALLGRVEKATRCGG
ncbi:MAG: hypothetical protein ACXV5N_07670 [Halobacteriota archaeon]